eukprot:3298850-Prorocentrum_lima.AAC.1
MLRWRPVNWPWSPGKQPARPLCLSGFWKGKQRWTLSFPAFLGLAGAPGRLTSLPLPSAVE